MIVVTFQCGHQMNANGSEGTLACGVCGESVVQQVQAPMPTFRGHARGPHAEYSDLPAKAVTFGETKNG